VISNKRISIFLATVAVVLAPIAEVLPDGEIGSPARVARAIAIGLIAGSVLLRGNGAPPSS